MDDFVHLNSYLYKKRKTKKEVEIYIEFTMLLST